MVATNLKAETVGLMDRRAAVEAEMDAIIAALSVPVGPGITGGLVDAEVGNPEP
jgi:26S proteasome non-ATPase regulatory subunit 9